MSVLQKPALMFLPHPPTHRCTCAFTCVNTRELSHMCTHTHAHTKSDPRQLYLLRMLVITVHVPHQVLRPLRTRGPQPPLCPAQNQHSRYPGNPPSDPQALALPPTQLPLPQLCARGGGCGEPEELGAGSGGCNQQMQTCRCPAGFRGWLLRAYT